MMHILLLICFVLFPISSYSKSEKTPNFSDRVIKKLQKIDSLIEKHSYQQAQEKLQAILLGISENSYEQAFVLRSLYSVHARAGNYKKAAYSLSKCLALKLLPEIQQQQGLLNLGRLYMAMEQYADAISILESWLSKHPNPDQQVNILVANAYAQLKHFRKALPYVKKAIAQSKKPKESWYQLNLALYYELEKYISAIDVLKKLIRNYPEKQIYWQQLSSSYQQVKQYKKALSVKHLAYKNGFLHTEKDILELASLFLYVDSPFKAAKILEKEFNQKRIKQNSKNWEKLANAWTMAKEFDLAVKALETASGLNSKGSLYLQLGQIYVEQEEWEQAIKSLNQALNKGGLKNKGLAYLLLGMSYYELNDLKLAKSTLLKATKYSKSKKAAGQWIEYIKKSG